MKRFLFIMAIIMTLFVIEPKSKNNISIAGENDLIKWNNHEVEDALV